MDVQTLPQLYKYIYAHLQTKCTKRLYLVRPAFARWPGSNSSTGSSATSWSSTTTSWAAQVSKVNLQLGCNVISWFTEVVISRGIINRGLQEKKREHVCDIIELHDYSLKDRNLDSNTHVIPFLNDNDSPTSIKPLKKKIILEHSNLCLRCCWHREQIFTMFR